MTQAAQIQKHLEKGGKLTPIQALNRFGCFRLAARIAELRNQGMNIISETVKREGRRYARYYLP
jgi:hypothetical protein